MDPTEVLPNEVAGLVFSYLSAKDLMECSLINSNWNRCIGSSLESMKKLKLEMRSDWTDFTEDVKKIIINGRKYRNLLFSDATESLNFMFNIVEVQQRVVSFQLYDTKFKANVEFLNLFRLIESSVEILTLDRVTIEDHEDTKLDLHLHRLKKLKICQCDESVVIRIFQNCPRLEAVILTDSGVNLKNRAEFLELLMQLDKLKRLQIDAAWLNFIFSADVQGLKFQLEKFSLRFCGSSVDLLDTETNITNFLKTQIDNIKNLQITGPIGRSLMSLIFVMTKLKILGLHFVSAFTWFLMELPTSNSIEILDIRTIDSRDDANIRTILKCTPNVKDIRLRSLSENLARFIAENLKQIKKISSVHPPKSPIKKALPNVQFEC